MVLGVAVVQHLVCLPHMQATVAALGHLVKGAGAVMLQREVPEHVNEAVAAAAAAAGVPVLLVSQPTSCPPAPMACPLTAIMLPILFAILPSRPCHKPPPPPLPLAPSTGCGRRGPAPGTLPAAPAGLCVPQ